MSFDPSKLPERWQHQDEFLARSEMEPEYGLFWEMGTGKSRAIIERLRNVYNAERRIVRTLILSPKIVLENWRNEFLRYSKIDPSRLVLFQGDTKRRARSMDRAIAKHGTHLILICNYEKLATSVDVRERIYTWHPEILICDESQRLKSPTSLRTKAVLEVSERRKNPAIRFKYILSGTPILRDVMDLFAQFLILDGGKTFGTNFWAFKIAHMEDKNAKWKGKPNYFPKWEMKPGSVDKINAAIQARTMRVRKSECLDLPPLVRSRRYVDMTADQARIYKEMKRDFIAFLASGEATVATMALTKALRLLQIASGYVQTETAGAKQIAGTPKQELLEELLQELTPNHKVIVWAVFRENYKQIRAVFEKLGISYTEVHGEVPEREKFENIERFRTDPSIRVLLGHPGSGGIGVNMVVASYSIFYSRNFSLDESLQAEARNHRGGSEIHEKITRIDLVTRGTIEEQVLERLENKESISDATLRELVEKGVSDEW